MLKGPNDLFLTPDICKSHRDDGVVYLRSNTPVSVGPENIIFYLNRWAEQRPHTVFLAERDKDDPAQWVRVTYLEFRDQVARLAAHLRDLGLSADRPLMLLSGNSIANAQLMFACYFSGVPVVPVSPSYSLLSKTFDKVLHIQNLTGAEMVFVEDTHRYSGVLETLDRFGLKVIVSEKNSARANDIHLQDLLDKESACLFTPPIINGQDVAKVLFTSGSTGMPKGVINTHRMMCINQEAMAAVWPFIEEPGHVFVDWLPWHHTFGGNHNLNMVLRNGASLYIDSGKATHDGVIETVRNIKDKFPTVYFNVAVGYDMLASKFESDSEAARSFFKNLRLLFFAAAALPESTRLRLERLIDEYADHAIPITSSWGQTETSPAGTSMHFYSRLANNIGVPLPGVELKLAPVGEMLELRIRGQNVMPSYYENPEKTAEAFDEEGFLCTGDAVELADNNHPEQGLIFKGRVNENFKLSSGTWVNVGELRLAVVSALAPLVSDVAICGHNENYVSALLFPNVSECADFVCDNGVVDFSENKKLHAEFKRRLANFNEQNPASSRSVARALIESDSPSFEMNEITDKGYLNQRGILLNRKCHVESLYRESPPLKVIII